MIGFGPPKQSRRDWFRQNRMLSITRPSWALNAEKWETAKSQVRQRYSIAGGTNSTRFRQLVIAQYMANGGGVNRAAFIPPGLQFHSSFKSLDEIEADAIGDAQ